MFYLAKTPWLIKKLYPEYIWDIKVTEKILFLTFDDGPHPEATPFVLEQLKKYNAKATFFCIGKNVLEHFEIYKHLITEGHKPANHTYTHLNGWITKDDEYLNDVYKASNIIDSNLFRPPYGKATKFQLRALKNERFQLKTIMWDVLSGDFDEKITGENCYLNVINNTRSGSIIVFHDSLKALPRLQYALPRILEYFSERKFQFNIIS